MRMLLRISPGMPLGCNGAKALAILSCPGCSHRLRVPDNKRGTVTCPLCGSEWFHPEVIELSSVEFRCSAGPTTSRSASRRLVGSDGRAQDRGRSREAAKRGTEGSTDWRGNLGRHE